MIIRIKEVVKRKLGLTITQFHKKWHEVFEDDNYSLVTFHSWSNGSRQPDYDVMDKFCFILDCRLDEIFQPHTVRFKDNYKNAVSRVRKPYKRK